MKAKDITIPGYGRLDIILAHYAAIPTLVHSLNSFNPSISDWCSWDNARVQTDRFSELRIDCKEQDTTVWILGEDTDECGYVIYGVHSTKEKAQQARVQFQKKFEYTDEEMRLVSIDQKEIDFNSLVD